MFKVLDEACTPERGSKFSACIDLKASEDVVIGAGETKMIGLGVCIDLPKSNDNVGSELWKSRHYLQLMLRSSLGKKGLILPNGVGVIDLDYRDEIKMIIHNPMQFEKADHRNLKIGVDFEIKKGDRIAQITLLEHKAYLFGIDTDEERDGGFGSTNKEVSDEI